MHCECSSLPDVFKCDAALTPACWRPVDTSADRFVTLHVCEACGDHWQLDAADKYAISLAIKIHEPANWASFDDTRLRLDHLAKSRGGCGAEACRWSGCDGLALKGLAFCARHAYQKMGLRE